MAQEKREKHWFQKERRKDRTKDRARMLGKKWERERQGEREFRIKFTVFKFFFLVSLLSLFWSLSLSRDLFCSFLHRFVSYRLLSRSLHLSWNVAPRATRSFISLSGSVRFFSNSFLRYSTALNGRLGGKKRERTSSGDDVSRISPAPPPINFPQFVLFLKPSVRNIIVTVLPVNSRYSSKVNGCRKAWQSRLNSLQLPQTQTKTISVERYRN